MKFMERFLYVVMTAIMSSCATMPTGPSVNVLPAPGKPFSQFQSEDANCRKWAEHSVGVSPTDVQNQNTAGGAAIGAVGGAGAGALLGAASGHAGAGAAIGAGTGLLLGTVIGSEKGRVTAREAQRRYDIAYEQCMTSSGNQVVNRVPRRRVIVVPPPPPPVYYETPPAEYQPPPPASTEPGYPPPGTPPPVQ